VSEGWLRLVCSGNFELPIITKSGDRLEVLLNVTSRRDVSGKVVGVVGVGQDVTERKRAELEKSRYGLT